MTSTLFSLEWMEFFVKGLILFLLGGACAMLARRSSASVRHGIWTLTLGSVLALPALSICMPSVNIPVLSARPLRTGVCERMPAAGPERSNAAVSPAGYPTHVVGTSTVRPDRLPSKHGTWTLRVVVFLWSCGIACFAAKLLVDAWRADRATRRMRPLPGAGWTRLIHTLAERAKIAASVRIGVCPGLSTPITWGLRRPVILLPLGAEDWPDDRRTTVLLHELAHIQRRDHIWNLLCFLSLGLHWLNPLAWYAYRQLAIERERATDDRVLRAGIEGCDYASHLLALVRDLPRFRLAPWPTSTMANSVGLRCRLHSLLDERISRAPLSTRMLLIIIPVAVALLAMLAPMHLSSSQAQEQIIEFQETMSGSRGGQSTWVHEFAPHHAISLNRDSQVQTRNLRPDTEEGREASDLVTASEPSRSSCRLWRIPPLGSWLGRRGEPREGRSSLIPPLKSVIGELAASGDKRAGLLPPLTGAMPALVRDMDKTAVDPSAVDPATKEWSLDERLGSIILVRGDRMLAP